MANRTNSSEYFWSYEYYWDYIDPIPVDGSKLKVNKYSIVITFWVGLAAFVMFLFLILLCMSSSGSTPVKEVHARAPGHELCWLQTELLQQVTVGSQREESSSNGEQPHCDDFRSPYSDAVAS